jgi:hypothetical protein
MTQEQMKVMNDIKECLESIPQPSRRCLHDQLDLAEANLFSKGDNRAEDERTTRVRTV